MAPHEKQLAIAPLTEATSRNRGQSLRATAGSHGTVVSRSTSETSLGTALPTADVLNTRGFWGTEFTARPCAVKRYENLYDTFRASVGR